MASPKRVLCVCIGNSDRSPLMAAVLQMYLDKAGQEVVCESVGIDEKAAGTGAPAAPFGIRAGGNLGLDISKHKRRHISSVNVDDFDLIVCASDHIAAVVMGDNRERLKRIHNADIANPWPVQRQEQFENKTMPAILTAMYEVVRYHFPPPAPFAAT